MKKYKSKFNEEQEVSFSVSLHTFPDTSESFLVLSGINRENDTETSSMVKTLAIHEFNKMYKFIKKEILSL